MVREQVIVAMKGHPGTGKSTLASAVASAFHIPLVDKDDVKDSMYHLSSIADHTSLNALSYNAAFQIASTQLRLGLSVVVDSPLSRRAYLNRLIDVAASCRALLIVVECSPRDGEEWRRRVESRGQSDQSSWHKPSTWRDVEKLLEEYEGCTDYDFGDVPKLVLDTTEAMGTQHLVGSVGDFIVANGGPSFTRYRSG